MMRALTIIACAAATNVSAQIAHAQSPDAAPVNAPRADSLYVTGHWDSGFVSGPGGEVEWLSAFSPRSAIVAGGGSNSRGGASWTYGRFGSLTRRSHAILMATGDLGFSIVDTVRAPYVKYGGTITIPMPGRFYVEADAQSVHANHGATQVVKAGTSFAGLRHTMLNVAVHQSTLAGTSGGRWRYVSARADVTRGRFGVATGFTTGAKVPESRSSVLEVIAQTAEEWFTTLSVGSRRFDTIYGFEAIRQPGGRVGRLVISLRVPLAPRSPEGSEPHE